MWNPFNTKSEAQALVEAYEAEGAFDTEKSNKALNALMLKKVVASTIITVGVVAAVVGALALIPNEETDEELETSE